MALAILALLPVVLLIDLSRDRPLDSSVMRQPGCHVAAHYLNASRDGIIQQYNIASAEISRRLGHEHLLVVLKFTLAGAIIALMFKFYSEFSKPTGSDVKEIGHKWFTPSRGAAVCSWVAVAICCIVDIRIQANSRILAALGDWIRIEVEPCILPIYFMGWEWFYHDMIQIDPLFPWIYMDRMVFSIFLYCAVMYVLLLVPFRAGDGHAGVSDCSACRRAGMHISIWSCWTI